MRDILVHVTAAHIRAGRPGSVSACPLTLAATEATGQQCYLTCHCLSVPGRFFAGLPPPLREASDTYHRTGGMEPTAFVIGGRRGAHRIVMAD